MCLKLVRVLDFIFQYNLDIYSIFVVERQRDIEQDEGGGEKFYKGDLFLYRVVVKEYWFGVRRLGFRFGIEVVGIQGGY